MSILNALKSQSNSIDDLAKLPQLMIMQMAQKGQIREDMVAPILARKAEMAQAVANTRAMQQGAPEAQPTVMDQIMNQNAMAEAPVPQQAPAPQQMPAPQQVSAPPQMQDVGVAQLPIPQDMYTPQTMAGGGIVAFQDNPDQPISEDMPKRELTDEELAYLQENPYLQRSRAVSEFFGNVGKTFTDPKNYNPFSVYQRAIGDPFARAANKFVNESPEDQAKRFRTGQQARTGEIPMFVGNELTTKGKMVADGRMKPNENVVDAIKRERDSKNFNPQELQKQYEAQDKQEGPGIKSGNVSTTKPKPKNIAEDKAVPAEVKTTPEEPLYAKYEKMLMDEREAAKGARNEAKWSRLLEAGLGVMGGDSPYAFVNIGKGSAPALRGYGEDVKGLRAEERGRVKELLGIEGMRQDAKKAAEELAIRKEMAGYAGIQARAAETAARRPTSVGELAALYQTNPELARLIQGEKKAGVLTFEDAYKLIAADPKNLTLTDAQKAQKAKELMALGGVGGTTGPADLNYVPGKGVK